jgi:2-polyprenyl-3-methyl-5-hydroxy-6-metoxy-1,4-benzoquinol methylase
MDRRVTDHEWWHVIDLPDGTSTPGGWDLRRTAAELPWPPIAGKRCLDVGTADGFWAFELERRGAADVLATDIPSPFQSRCRRKFELARELRGSSVRYEPRGVHELEGEFDVVFMGFVLQMLTDPIGALESIRRVCSGHLLLLDTVSAPLSLLRAPLARLDARRDGREWFVFNRRGMRKVVELAGWTVEAQTGILADRPGPLAVAQRAHRSWKWRVGVRGRSCAILAA